MSRDCPRPCLISLLPMSRDHPFLWFWKHQILPSSSFLNSSLSFTQECNARVSEYASHVECTRVFANSRITFYIHTCICDVFAHTCILGPLTPPTHMHDLHSIYTYMNAHADISPYTLFTYTCIHRITSNGNAPPTDKHMHNICKIEHIHHMHTLFWALSTIHKCAILFVIITLQ